MTTVRIHKLLAKRGVASRREAERMVLEGRVTVNGETIVHPGHAVDPKTDRICVDEDPIPEQPRTVYYLLHKPRGVITSRRDPQGRKGVLDLVTQLPERVEPVGRLDINTSGALLLTNDGDLAHKLTHPRSEIPKRYHVKVWRTPTPKTLERIRKGIHLEDGRTSPCKIRVIESTDTENAWLEITVTEGRNRLIRRMLEAVNHPVSKLRRVSFATISLRGLESGELRPLSGDEVQRLRDIAVGIRPKKAGHNQRNRSGFAKAKPKPKGKPLSKKKSSRQRNRNGR